MSAQGPGPLEWQEPSRSTVSQAGVMCPQHCAALEIAGGNKLGRKVLKSQNFLIECKNLF